MAREKRVRKVTIIIRDDWDDKKIFSAHAFVDLNNIRNRERNGYNMLTHLSIIDPDKVFPTRIPDNVIRFVSGAFFASVTSAIIKLLLLR